MQMFVLKHPGDVTQPGEFFRAKQVGLVQARLEHDDPGNKVKDDEYDNIHQDKRIPG
jgi:hypothetical protein